MPTRHVVIDHLTVGVSDLATSRRFYSQALQPLGFREIGPWTAARRDTSFGLEDANDFAISQEYEVGGQLHIAFAADTRAEVDAFHAAALAAGGRDNGPPGPRPEYAENYYAAFVLDPDGHNVGAVCHAPDHPNAARSR
jgi:catechol 2,3-dioxygenase-like lactoylglutathione lyase family enzyme